MHISFSVHAIKQPDKVLVVEDASKDSRFADFPQVKGEEHIRFYAAKPLLTPDGYALGTLCVVDKHPRSLSKSQETGLSSLAQAVVSLLGSQRKSLASSINLAVEQALQHGVVITDPGVVDNPVIYCNMTYESLTGYPSMEVIGKPYNLLDGKDTDPDALAELRAAIDHKQDAEVILKSYRKDGSEFWNEFAKT